MDEQRLTGEVVRLLYTNQTVAGGFIEVGTETYYLPARTACMLGIKVKGARVSFIPSPPRDGGRRDIATSVMIEQEVKS